MHSCASASHAVAQRVLLADVVAALRPRAAACTVPCVTPRVLVCVRVCMYVRGVFQRALLSFTFQVQPKVAASNGAETLQYRRVVVVTAKQYRAFAHELQAMFPDVQMQ